MRRRGGRVTRPVSLPDCSIDSFVMTRCRAVLMRYVLVLVASVCFVCAQDASGDPGTVVPPSMDNMPGDPSTITPGPSVPSMETTSPTWTEGTPTEAAPSVSSDASVGSTSDTVGPSTVTPAPGVLAADTVSPRPTEGTTVEPTPPVVSPTDVPSSPPPPSAQPPDTSTSSPSPSSTGDSGLTTAPPLSPAPVSSWPSQTPPSQSPSSSSTGPDSPVPPSASPAIFKPENTPTTSQSASYAGEEEGAEEPTPTPSLTSTSEVNPTSTYPSPSPSPQEHTMSQNTTDTTDTTAGEQTARQAGGTDDTAVSPGSIMIVLGIVFGAAAMLVLTVCVVHARSVPKPQAEHRPSPRVFTV